MIQGRRTGRGDERYARGQVIYGPKVRETGGGPDGHYFTVLVSRLTPPCEDNGQYDWTEYAWVRAATDEEAAPVAARVAAKELREQLARELGSMSGERVSGPMPEGAVVLVTKKPNTLVSSGERVAVVDGTILHERVGDPDMCDAWHHYVVRITPSPELLERVQAFIAAGGAQ